MPIKKALENARINGYVASGHNQPVTHNPYTKSHARAYCNAWLAGWFAFLFEQMPETAIECDECHKESLYPDIVNDEDVWLCRECGYCAPNLEVQEMKESTSGL